MKRMHEFLQPNVSKWSSTHSGTGTMTQDGTVITSNDEDAIDADESTVYKFDHFDANSGKYIFKLVSNQFTFPSVAVGSLQKNGVKFDIDDQSLWIVDLTIAYLYATTKSPGLYAWPTKKANGADGFDYVLINKPADSMTNIYTGGYVNIANWLNGLKEYFISLGCQISEDGYKAIIPGKYLELVSDDTAKISILPQEIALEPDREPIFLIVETHE